MDYSLRMTHIYTDGACLGNPGPGGWAAVILKGDSKRVVSGSEPNTTNNRMEILAVKNGLQELPARSNVTVFTDSSYVVNTMSKNWRRKKNNDLWELLDIEVGIRNVIWEWVPGHSGVPFNEEADRVASEEAKMLTAAGANKNNSGQLTHVDESGKATMVDVGDKPITRRVAMARGIVSMHPLTADMIKSNNIEKGDVLSVARVAGIMAAKNTSQLIPLCHPLPIDQIILDFQIHENELCIEAKAKTTAKTGIEMEAMTAVSIAALTVYDMCKSVDRSIKIESVRLVEKTGGKSENLVLED
jgi:cyclic pyranopterin phosphate synthase